MIETVHNDAEFGTVMTGEEYYPRLIKPKSHGAIS